MGYLWSILGGFIAGAVLMYLFNGTLVTAYTESKNELQALHVKLDSLLVALKAKL